MRLRRASIIATLFLLASAATAYAECAWCCGRRSWRRIRFPTSTWSVNIGREDIFETREACESESERRLDAELGSWSREADYEAFWGVTVPGVTVSRKGATDYLFHVSYHCLPDAVDPRGVKGK